jgi:glycosyltransferase involved in cell wall biosynthesis
MPEKKIRICHLSSVHLAYDTRIYYRLCKSLTSQYEVYLLACDGQKDKFDEDDVNFIPYPRYKNRIFRVFTSWILVLIKALKINAKLYHIHDPELIPTALFLRLIGKKVIFDIHENVAEDIFDKEWIKFPRLYYNFFAFYEWFVVRTCYIFLAEKSYEKRYAKIAKRYSVVYNYCDLKFFEKFKSEERDPKKLFYCGILFENRGVLQIAEAIHLLEKEKGMKVEFHCVGELYYELRIKLESLPYYETIKDRLFFYGRKKLGEAYEIGRNCGIGMSIIHRMSNSVESYPTKLFEYMACGMPSIVSNFPLYESIVKKEGCGLSVNPKSGKEISEAVFTLNSDVDLYRKMSKNGSDVVEKSFNWETEKKKVLKVYKELLANGR